MCMQPRGVYRWVRQQQDWKAVTDWWGHNWNAHRWLTGVWTCPTVCAHTYTHWCGLIKNSRFKHSDSELLVCEFGMRVYWLSVSSFCQHSQLTHARLLAKRANVSVYNKKSFRSHQQICFLILTETPTSYPIVQWLIAISILRSVNWSDFGSEDKEKRQIIGFK